MLEYGILLGIVLGVIALYYVVAPKIKNEKIRTILAVVQEVVTAVEQTTHVPEEETPEEKEARHKEMKLRAMNSVKKIAEDLGIKVPSEALIDSAIEAAVWVLKATGKFQ
jgi:hypothetical protein